MIAVIVLSLLSIFCGSWARPYAPPPGNWSFDTCTFTTPNGSVFDLSSIAYNSSSWAHLVSASPHPLSSSETITTALFRFELALCGPVKTSFGCATPFSAVNVVGPDGTCTKVGDYRVASFAVLPYNDGIVLRYYFGDPVSHDESHYSSLFLICGDNAPWYFEHMLAKNQWHFKLMTPLGCWR